MPLYPLLPQPLAEAVASLAPRLKLPGRNVHLVCWPLQASLAPGTLAAPNSSIESN